MPRYQAPPEAAGAYPGKSRDVPSEEVDVIGLGENSVDRVMVVPRLPGAPGAPSKVRVAAAVRSCGGQVATTMAACASLGLRAAYAGTVGADDDGRFVRETLVARGVSVNALHTIAGAVTRWASILVDAANGERVVMWNRDELLTMTAGQVDAIDVNTARLVHVDDADLDASIRLGTAARKAGRLVSTDIDAQVAQVAQVRQLLTIATHPILSERALVELSGERDPERGLRRLRNQCGGVLCVTLGSRGAMALDGERLVTSPGFSVTAVDTTGAGDVFRAGFIVSVLAGRGVDGTLRFANAAAALSCTRLGAIGGVPTLEETETLLAGYRRSG